VICDDDSFLKQNESDQSQSDHFPAIATDEGGRSLVRGEVEVQGYMMNTNHKVIFDPFHKKAPLISDHGADFDTRSLSQLQRGVWLCHVL
jgi:hypothetical protein